MVSFEALCEQGYDRSFFDGFSSQSQESLRFSTGCGQRNSSVSIGFQDRSGLFGKANHFILDSCPLVRSIGVDVEQNGLGFIWLPGSEPYYVCNPAEVLQNVPFFKASFHVIPGVPAEAGASCP